MGTRQRVYVQRAYPLWFCGGESMYSIMLSIARTQNVNTCNLNDMDAFRLGLFKEIQANFICDKIGKIDFNENSNFCNMDSSAILGEFFRRRMIINYLITQTMHAHWPIMKKTLVLD